MNNNCLITKLNASVSDTGLQRLGCYYLYLKKNEAEKQNTICFSDANKR